MNLFKKLAIKDKYIIRHKILGVLNQGADKEMETDNHKDIYFTAPQIYEQIKDFKENEIWKNIEYLAQQHEIGHNGKDKDSDLNIFATGRIRFFDDYYLDYGWDKFVKSFLNSLTAISTTMAIIAALSAIKESIEDRDQKGTISKMQSEISVLQQQVIALKHPDYPGSIPEKIDK